MKSPFARNLRPAQLLMAFAFATLSTLSPALAYFSVIDTGHLIEPETFQVSVEPQLVLSRYDGFNIVSRFDTGLNNESSLRGILGFGKVDFQVGGFYKYIPFPDTATQPAIGGEAGVIFARVDGETEFSVRIHPLVSKSFQIEIGDITPYGSLPFGVTSRPKETIVPVQLVGGAELRPLNLPNTSFFAELGINVNKSFSYISLAAAFRFDEAALRGK